MPVEDWDAVRDMFAQHETEGFAESQALSDFLDSFPIKNEVITSGNM